MELEKYNNYINSYDLFYSNNSNNSNNSNILFNTEYEHYKPKYILISYISKDGSVVNEYIKTWTNN